MFRTARAGGRAIGVVKLTGMGAAHFGQNSVKRLHARGAIFRNPSLGQRRSRKTDGQSRYQKNRARAHGRFLAFFE
jgi:hypothetical protein